MSACIRLILAVAFLFIVFGARTALADNPLPQAGPTPTPVPTSDHNHATPAAGSTATTSTPNAPSAADILYADNFTDPTTGWPNALVFGNYYVGYHEPEYYHIEVRAPQDRAIVAVPKQTFDDFTVQSKVFVEPNNTNPTGDFRYGLMFRRTGGQYYAFMISPRTNTWQVVKSSPSGITELAKGTSDAIQGLKTPDELRVDAKGSSFAFHINDQAVGQVSDGEYGQGEVGFIVETADSPRVHIHYDDIAVGKIESPVVTCTILVANLNLRQGPGTKFPVVGYASAGATVESIGRSKDGNWLKLRVTGAPNTWISSAPIYVTCVKPTKDLPVQ